MDQDIIKGEVGYARCFSEGREDDFIIRFRDDAIKDMYDHNFTLIKKALPLAKLNEIILEEINQRKRENSSFAKIVINGVMGEEDLAQLAGRPEIERCGYYVFDPDKLWLLKPVHGAVVLKVVNQTMLDDVLHCDLLADEERLGRDFCQRRCYRKGKVYLAEGGVDAYVCYHHGEVIGRCDLFISGGIAKIEDFEVISEYRHQGYGSYVLRVLIETALSAGCHLIYLLTDEDDTAKEMYLKRGFHKAGERFALFYRFDHVKA